MDLIARTGKFTQGVRKAQGQLQGFANRSKGIMGGLAGSLKGAAPFAAVGLVTKAIQDMEAFNQAMTKSTAIMGNLSQETKKQMSEVARTVSRETLFSATEAAQAYYYLASAGMDAAQSMKALPQVAQFAQAGAFDLSQATDLLTDAQSALGLSSKDASTNLRNLTRVSDVLVKANTLANASVEQFSTALTNKAATAARAAGKDVEEVVAVLSAFADQGIKAEEAGTAFNIVMRDLQTKAISNSDAFARMGIKVFDSAGNMNNLADIVGQLENAMSGLSAEQQRVALGQLGFSDKSIAFTQALFGMSDKIREYERQLRSASGTTKSVANDMVTPLQRSMNKLNATWEDFTQTVGPPVINELVEIATAFSRITEAAKQAIAELDKLKQRNFGGGDSKFAITNIPVINDILDSLQGKKDEAKKITRSASRRLIRPKTSQPVEVSSPAPSESPAASASSAPRAARGVGAVDARSAEGFNNLQRAIQQQKNQQIEESKKQTTALQNLTKEVADIRRSVQRPTTEIEFA